MGSRAQPGIAPAPGTSIPCSRDGASQRPEPSHMGHPCVVSGGMDNGDGADVEASGSFVSETSFFGCGPKTSDLLVAQLTLSP